MIPARQACGGTVQTCYPQSLKQAINQHLPCGLFKPGGATATVRWCERYLTLCALLMAWSMADTLADRFDAARQGVADLFPGRRRPGRSYQGFAAALARRSDALLKKLAEHLRGEVRVVAGERHWEHRGFVPMGGDGSKVECPRTASNELAFGCAGKNKSTPQQFITTLLHLPTGVVWQFTTGPACSSERDHLRQMLPALPANALLIADAGFTGYDLLTGILAGGHSFLIRVGSNVNLLLKLGYAMHERAGTVYLWPDEARRKQQPPLILRLITLVDGRNRRMCLLTRVSESRMSEAAALEFYAMRWNVELHYRAFKQTLARRKLRSAAPAMARTELCWAMMGLWLLCLMAAGAIIRSGQEVRRLSVARALRLVRQAMAAPRTRSGSAGLGKRLATALKDCYTRKTSKRARDWPHKKKSTPPGQPNARIADESQVEQALKLKQQLLAA